MGIERERTFIANLDQTRRLAEHAPSALITQHYLSPIDSHDELRIRRSLNEADDPSHFTTIKQGRGEYRTEYETTLLSDAFDTLSLQALATVCKRRHQLYLPGLTLDTHQSGPARLYGGLLEIEQHDDTGDIGLFDPRSLGVGDMTEVTALPDFSNRHLATPVRQLERALPTASLDHIYDHIDVLQTTTKPSIITLSGPSGSGKTTILEQFKSKYGDRCTTISTDDYYIGKTLMRAHMPEGHSQNFDHPAAIDTARLAHDLHTLTTGQSVTKPLYDMKRSEPNARGEMIKPNDIIIVEGIAANLPEVRELSDASLVMSASVDERLRRRIKRDVQRKGHTTEETLRIFMNHVEPSYQAYFAPHDAAADFLINSEPNMI